MRYKEESRILSEAMGWLSSHAVRPSETRSWTLTKNGQRGGCYWYTVTWAAPGTLSVAGDLGTLTLTHYHAMPTWFDAVTWLGKSRDFTYHLSKSPAREVYDPEGTYHMLVEDLTGSNAVDALKDYRDALREWRDDLREANKADPEVDIWEGDTYGPSWEARPEFDARAEGVRPWVRLLDEVGFLFGYGEAQDVLRRKCRRALLKELRTHLETQEQAYGIISKLGIEDFYGATRWEPQRLYQMAAIYRWAEMMLTDPEYIEEMQRRDRNYEFTRQVLAMDQRMKPASRYEQPAPGMIEFQRHDVHPVAHAAV